VRRFLASRMIAPHGSYVTFGVVMNLRDIQMVAFLTQNGRLPLWWRSPFWQ